MKKGIKTMNFWQRTVEYSPPRAAQNVWNPQRNGNISFMSAESYDSCGDYDEGCASGGDE